MVKLARVDFANTDPAQLRAAVKLPRSLKLRPQGVAMRIGVKIGGGDEEFQDFMLREVSDPGDVLVLNKEIDANTHILAYRLEPGEVDRLVAFRDALNKKQEASGRRGGSITISIRPDACRTGDLPDRPVYVTTFVQTGETGGYVPLARDLDLRTVSPGRNVAAAIPPCG